MERGIQKELLHLEVQTLVLNKGEIEKEVAIEED